MRPRAKKTGPAARGATVSLPGGYHQVTETVPLPSPLFFAIGLLLCLLIQSCQKIEKSVAPQLNWQTDWEQAAKISQQETRPMFVAFETEWCPYCKYVEEKIFPDPAVRAKLESLVLLKVDGDKAQNQPLMAKYNVEGFPTYLVFDPKGKEQTRFQSVYQPTDFLENLKAVGSPPEEEAENTVAKAEHYTSAALQKKILKQGAATIEENLKKADQLDAKTLFLLLDEQIDQLVEIYQKLEQFDKIAPLYKKAAGLAEQWVNRDGIANSKHLFGLVGYHYRKAGQPQETIRFLTKALKIYPDYWPIHSGLAKAYADEGNWSLAVEHAQKGYELAEEVAKSKLALTLAEIFIAQEKTSEAVAVLQKGISDLGNLQDSSTGRAAKMKEKLQKQIEEYQGSQNPKVGS